MKYYPFFVEYWRCYYLADEITASHCVTGMIIWHSVTSKIVQYFDVNLRSYVIFFSLKENLRYFFKFHSRKIRHTHPPDFKHGYVIGIYTVIEGISPYVGPIFWFIFHSPREIFLLYGLNRVCLNLCFKK